MSTKSILFKYRAINQRLIDSIVNPTWYFAKPDTLNDPFDCRVDIHKALTRAANSTSGLRSERLKAALKRSDGMLDAWVKQFADFGVLALSQTSVSELLWAHYADNHRGVVLSYQFDKRLFEDSPHTFVGMDIVKYGQNAVTEYLRSAAIDQQKPNGFVEELGRLYLTAKSEAWSHEEEVRIIRTTAGTMEIPRDTLRGIIFGLRTPQSDIDRLTKLATQHTDCDAFAKMQPDNSDFGLMAQRI